MKLFKKAILVIHGFAGGVYDQEYLTHELELISNYDVYTFTLPGHDGNFNTRITSQDWVNKVDSEMKFLIDHGYKSIFVIGHSMGGVLASYIASKYKQVKKLVLVAPAFRISGFETGNFNITTAINAPSKIFEQYGLQLVTNRMLKLPPNCYFEFIKLVKSMQGVIVNVKVPTLIFRGNIDTIVPQESVEYVYDSLSVKYKKNISLDKVTHDVFRDNKKKQVTSMIIKFFKCKSSIKRFPDIIKKDDD